MKNNPLRLAMLGVGVFFAGAGQAGTTSYTVTDLRSRDEPAFVATANNNAGQVAGSMSPSSGAYRAVVWNGTQPTGLGLLTDGAPACRLGTRTVRTASRRVLRRRRIIVPSGAIPPTS